MDGGHKSVAIGLGTYSSVRPTTTSTRCATRSRFMDPTKSELHRQRQPPGRHRRGRRPDLPRRDDAQQRHVRRAARASWPSPRRAGPRATQATFAALKRATDRMPPEAAPRRLPRRTAPYALTGVQAGAVEPGARGHARARRRAAGGRRAGARPTSSRRAAVHRPVQRQLDPEPDPRDVPGARLLLQPLPGRAARARGRRADLHAPGHARVPPGPPPLLRRLLRGGADARPPTRRRSSSASRRATPRTSGTATCTGRATPTTASTRSTCGTGARTASSTSVT